MKRKLMTIIALLTAMFSVWAQTGDRGQQILVFRNTGEVNLFYSNEVDSITTNETSQIFYTADTMLVVPYSELDSVAVGSRNEMKFHADVKELTEDDDFPWIIRFDGQSIFYRLDTPTHILPSVGQKLFYGLEEQRTEDSLFPYGLCVKVTNVIKLAEEMRVDVEVVQLQEIFERLFLAGHINSSKPLVTSVKRNIHKAPVNANVNLRSTINVEDMGSVSIDGNLSIDGDIVLNLLPFRNHQHADLNLTYGFGTNVTLEARENGSFQYEDFVLETRVGTFYGILNLDAAAGAFADLSAEMNLGVDLQRTYKRKLIWDRKGDESTFEFREATADEPYEDKAQIDLTLNGELHFGPIIRIGFATVGDLVGAYTNIKVGPRIAGEISLGMIRQSRDYQPSIYGNAKLNLRSQVTVEGFVTHRRNLVWGEIDEHQIFNRTFHFGEHEWKLFPDFSRCNATATTNKESEVRTDMAASIEEPTPTDLETGFEIVDPQGEVVDSVYVGQIEAEPKEAKPQTFEGEIELPKTIKQENLDGYTMRPIFHYAGYTVSAEPVDIKKDVNLQPYTSTQSNGAMAFISSGPFLGSVKHNETLYTLGAYLPVPQKKLKNDEMPTPIVPGQDITDQKADLLIGTWSGNMDDKEVILVLEEGETGSLTTDGQAPRTFTYELNTPQTGELLIMFEDEGDNLLLRVLSVNETTLRVINKRDITKSVITFQRQ